MRFTNAMSGVLLLLVAGFLTEQCHADAPEAKLVEQIVDAAGGTENLLKQFTITENLNVGKDPEKPGKPRESVFDAQNNWWFRGGKGGAWRKKMNEPATHLVRAWTLQLLLDEKSRLEVLPPIMEGKQTLTGIRISESVKPAMDIYYDKTSLRLVRIDWRKDIHRFSDWQEHDGAKYPATCIGYRKSTGKPWFVSKITKLQRLEKLPADLE